MGKMSVDDAAECLRFHAGHAPIREKSSFVSSLRPFEKIDCVGFAEIVRAMVAVHPMLQQNQVDRSVVYAGWDICSRLRYLAINEDSALRRNKLLDEESLKTLKSWERSIETFFMHAMHKLDLLDCLSFFLENFVNEKRETRMACTILLPILESAIKQPDVDDEIKSFATKAIATMQADRRSGH